MNLPKIALFFAFFCVSSQAFTSPAIHDGTQAFVSFWAHAKDLSLAEQIEAFDQMVYPTFPQFYQNIYEDWMEQRLEKGEELQKIFAAHAKIAENFAATAQDFSVMLQENLATFQKAFPGFAGDGEIYFIHSLNTMDGGTRDFGGPTVYSIFGADRIAERRKENHNESAFFHHELFHFYHLPMWVQSSKPEFNGMWRAIWLEGLATYVSHKLNPAATPDELALSHNLVNACTRDLPFLWKILETSFMNTDYDLYQALFLTSSQHARIPIRAGYYLGYLIAKELGATRTLDELAHLKQEEVLPLIRAIVEREAGKTASIPEAPAPQDAAQLSGQ